MSLSDEKKKHTKRQSNSLWAVAWRRLKAQRVVKFCFFGLIAMFLLCFIGPMLLPHTGYEINLLIRDHPPATDFWLGTDELGRDVLARLLLAGRISLTVGFASMLLSLVLGTIFGLLAGYFRGWVDIVIMRVVDLIMSIPQLPLLVILAALLAAFEIDPERRIYVVMLMLSLIGWPQLARMIRGQVLSLRAQMFMKATDVLGLSTWSKLFKHLLPNVLPLLVVVATLTTASSILMESSLSFLGLGVMPPQASWGNMLNAANNLEDFRFHWWLWLPPGLAILFTVVCINVLGDHLRDVLDPKTANKLGL